RFFYHAQEGKYEALIRRLHPLSYRRHFKAFDGRAIPAYYWGHFLAPFFALLSPALALALFSSGCCALIYAWSRRRESGFLDPFRLLFPALFVPYLRLFWVLLGEIRYPQSP